MLLLAAPHAQGSRVDPAPCPEMRHPSIHPGLLLFFSQKKKRVAFILFRLRKENALAVLLLTLEKTIDADRSCQVDGHCLGAPPARDAHPGR